jgi:P pilus assembly chaperone PapD
MRRLSRQETVMAQHGTRNARLMSIAAILLVFMLATSAVGQTVSPPIAEYRGKASGMVELRNDGDFPLATILEVKGFTVDEKGTLLYTALDSKIEVEFGASSFIIPAHQSHFVFYRTRSEMPSYWFAFLATLTRANADRRQMRLNFVLPHVVYVYQKPKLKRADVNVKLLTGEDGGLKLQIENHSEKLARVQSIETHGFEKSLELGGVPIFPAKQRFVEFNAGQHNSKANVEVVFEDGFTITVPVS